MVCQRYIFKIHSGRLRSAGWRLTLPISEARKNDEVVALADSQVLRWIDELNGVTDADAKAKEIKRQIRFLRKDPNSLANRREIRKLYEALDVLQFKPDYMCLVIDKNKDYHRACKGFTINGIKYCRLLGTTGGIKNSTIVFVSERLAGELKRRIDNGRDTTHSLVPAKFEAYQALTCSAILPVSMPHGILVVPDCETEFVSDVIYLDDEGCAEPMMETRSNVEIHLNASDGYGLMLPSLAERWSEELGLDYTSSGFNTRMSWEKGMVFAFDYLDFAENIAGSYLVKDAWGNEVDVRETELILTTSMLKLWDSYESCADYLEKSVANGYTFGVAKSCPKELENQRSLNYQFIQPLDLSPADIDELVAPTIAEFKDVLGGDWRKALVYLRGIGMNEANVVGMEDNYIKAIMADPRIFNDPHVKNSIYQLIRNRIDRAKTGVLRVHGNYSIVSGDPYALCQSIFGLPATGLLGAGEIYNEYWANTEAESLACFRAPMSCSNNIRRVTPSRSEEARYWYRHLHTSTVFNAWDTAMIALNGLDYDGDIIMLTDNPVIVRRLPDEPALMCVQRKADKHLIDEPLLIQANIDSFGSDIGQTTNRITSMYEVRSHYDTGSEEYQVLDYRIKSGQLYQQNSIDKAKGIIAKPMPKSWYDWHAAAEIEDPDKQRFYKGILAEKKPYFMRYIYPALQKQYNTYQRNTERNALRAFQMTVDEMLALPYCDLSQQQRDFLRSYHNLMPVGTGDCVMNRICRIFEREFDHGQFRFASDEPFDYTIMKSGAEYTKSQYGRIKKLFSVFIRRLHDYKVAASYERVNNYEMRMDLNEIREDFMRSCYDVCSNEAVLCDIFLDIFYEKSSNWKFVMPLCGSIIVQNLLQKNGWVLSFPVLGDGEDSFEYCGMTFHMQTVNVLEEE